MKNAVPTRLETRPDLCESVPMKDAAKNFSQDSPNADKLGDVLWEDGVPVSRAFEDPYYSRADGLSETRHVYLRGNDLLERWTGRDVFQITELGFGTGLNFCATWQAWEQAGATGRLVFTSFEAYPMTREDMAQALSVWPELAPWRDRLVAMWTPAGGRFDFGPVTLTVVIGDVRETLATWPGKADAWFLDGFAPARNPAMWEPSLMAQVAAASAPGATVATYTVAGAVRRGLAAAGFTLEKRSGFGHKRQMLTGYLSNCDSQAYIV